MEFSKKRIFLLLCLNIILFGSSLNLYAGSEKKLFLNKVSKLNPEESLNTNIKLNHYFLGPGDKLFVNFIYNKDFSSEIEIISDGTVSLPIVGTIFVQGLTLNEAKELIQDKLSKDLIRPEIQLTLTKSKPIKVAIIGEVARPGFYSLDSLEKSLVTRNELKLSGYPTLFSAIQKAGGITTRTNLKKVVIKRKISGFGSEYKMTTLNLFDALIEGNTEFNPILFDGDIVKLFKTDKLNNNDLSITKTNLYPTEIKVTVIGEVNSPGSIFIPANSTLNQAIMYAGGPIDWNANKGNVEIFRLNEDGSASLSRHKVDLTQEISKNNPLLKGADIVKVNSSLLSKTSKAMGAITKPFDGVFRIYTLFNLFDD